MNAVEGRVCVVTGGARGLGRAIAAALGGGGGRPALCDVLTDELEQTALDEYAGLVLYLAGEGHYLAGQVISPNGGMI